MDDPYLIAGTGTLRNLLDVTDPAVLARIEYRASRARLVQLDAQPLPGSYHLDHLRAFHRLLFGDVYDWAGELRTVNITKDTTVFADARFIEPAANQIFGDLAKERHLIGLSLDGFCGRAAHYLAEINALHPFREGNGRTQRAFLTQLASDAGWQIDWDPITPTENTMASIAGHAGDLTRWHQLLTTITTPIKPAVGRRPRTLRAVPPAAPQPT